MPKNSKTLYFSSGASNGDWIMLNPRDKENVRTIQVDMNAADTITIQATTKAAKDKNELADIIANRDIVVLKTYTGDTSFVDTINGPFTFIRAVKTGTAGVATVQGIF